jgi:hypothetical protein
MFCVSEAQAAIIRTAFEQSGELSAVVELRRLFPGVDNIAQARECVRIVAGWQPLLTRPSITPRRTLRKPRLSRNERPAADEGIGQRQGLLSAAGAGPQWLA